MYPLKVHENGAGQGTADWRDAAMGAALIAQGNDGNAVDILLQAIRLALPQAAALVSWQERGPAVDLLRWHPGDFHRIVSGKVLTRDDEEFVPYLGWWRGTWEGAEIEIVLPPSCSLVCIGDDEDLLQRFCQALRTQRPVGRCLQYSEGWRYSRSMEIEVDRITWDDVVLEPRLLASIRESVESFVGQKDAFRILGFPWKRGILLIGPPGTGKTMICRAAVSSLPELPLLYVRDMRERCGDTCRDVFSRARNLAPCILAFEDIDGFIDGSNRTVFLNELDGMSNNDGVLVIASSNHPEKIDEALLKRPSRFDRVFHIGLPAPEERREFCRRLLSRSELAEHLDPSLDQEALARAVAQKTDAFTPAYLKEAFLAAALQRAHAGAIRLDREFADTVLRQVDELTALMKHLRKPEELAELVGADASMGFRK